MKDTHSARETWKAFKAGDREALGIIFETYYPLLHHYGLNICHNRDLTEDLLQDFFLYLYEHRESLGELDSLKAYLFVSFKRMMLRKLKNINKHQYLLWDQIPVSNRPFEFSSEEVLIGKETHLLNKTVLTKTLNKLSKRQREVIYLRYYNDMSLHEIAAVMKISYQGVSNTLYKAFKSLRKDTSLLKIRDLVLVFTIWAVQLF